MELQAYQPVSKLQVRASSITRPRFPVVDAHNHLPETFGTDQGKQSAQEIVDVLDQAGVKVLVDLNGGWGEAILQRNLDKFKSRFPERFIHFGGVDWSQWAEKGDGFGDWAAQRLQVQVAWGAQGLKIWKTLGLQVRDHRENLAPVDDPRLDPLWETAAALNIPVMIHVADPVAFFDPLDEFNERWEELQENPDWHFPSPPYPAFSEVVSQLANLVTRHPNTTFIGAHVGCYAEDLAWVGSLLDRAQNFYVDISARIAELGRQPFTARKFALAYQDRILFGTDMGVDLDTYRIYYRFLETSDEYFDYDTSGVPTQGRWKIYGLNLLEPVLEKIYWKNACRVLSLGGDLQ